jgi:hypothetical protein
MPYSSNPGAGRVHFVVTPGETGWRVLREGDEIARHRTRADAEADAARRARQAFDAGEPVQIETRTDDERRPSSFSHDPRQGLRHGPGGGGRYRH